MCHGDLQGTFFSGIVSACKLCGCTPTHFAIRIHHSSTYVSLCNAHVVSGQCDSSFQSMYGLIIDSRFRIKAVSTAGAAAEENVSSAGLHSFSEGNKWQMYFLCMLLALCNSGEQF